MTGFADSDPAFVLSRASSRIKMGMKFPGRSSISKKHEENGKDFNPHDIKTVRTGLTLSIN